MINFSVSNNPSITPEERAECASLKASSLIAIKSIFEQIGVVQAKLQAKSASIANLFVQEILFARHLNRIPSQFYLEMILGRWEKAVYTLINIQGSIQEYKAFIQKERTFFHEQIKTYILGSITEESLKNFLSSEKPRYLQNVVSIISFLISSNFNDFLLNRMQLLLNYFSSLDKSLECFALKNGQAFIKEQFAPFILEKHHSICKRIERIWQSQQSQLLLPDDRLTLGRSFLEGPINAIVYQAIEQEIDACLIRQIIECFEIFEKTLDHFYILLSRDCYLKLNEREKVYFKDPFSLDGDSFRSIKRSFLSYITEGPLSNEVDFSLFCNPDLKCLFFEITNDQDKVVGHLLGSMHILPKDAAKLPKHIQKAFQAANAFAVEADIYKDMEIESIENLIVLNKASFTSLNNVSIALLDGEYLLAAKKMNKSIISLENNHKIKEIEDCIKKIPHDGSILIKQCPLFMRSGDLKALKDFHDENILKHMSEHDKHLVIYSRDKEQASGIDTYLRHHPEEKLFVMIGASHLPGVIPLLQEKGWHLKQVY